MRTQNITAAKHCKEQENNFRRRGRFQSVSFKKAAISLFIYKPYHKVFVVKIVAGYKNYWPGKDAAMVIIVVSLTCT